MRKINKIRFRDEEEKTIFSIRKWIPIRSNWSLWVCVQSVPSAINIFKDFIFQLQKQKITKKMDTKLADNAGNAFHQMP